jgi:hypothetical protein
MYTKIWRSNKPVFLCNKETGENERVIQFARESKALLLTTVRDVPSHSAKFPGIHSFNYWNYTA